MSKFIDLRQEITDLLSEQEELNWTDPKTPPGLSSRELSRRLTGATGLSFERTRVYVNMNISLMEAAGQVIRVGKKNNKYAWWELT